VARLVSESVTSPRPVDVDAIERELAGLWHEPLGSVAAGAEGMEPATRACMSNLLIWCATQEQARGLPIEIGTIVEKHPSRVLLLVGEPESKNAGLSASVSALCHPASAGRQICSEHVTLSAPSSSIARLPSIALPLLIGDLPTALWWAAPEPPTAGALFDDLAGMADHVIYDSAGWLDPVRGVVSVAGWAMGLETRRVVSDLAWRRGKAWRRLVGETLDPQVAPGALESIEEVEIEHGPHALPQAWFLIGWLAGRLGWRPIAGKVAPGVEVTWGFESGKAPLRVTVRRLPTGEPELSRVAIRWNAKAGGGAATFAWDGRERLSVLAGSSSATTRILSVRRESRSTLVARQMAKLFHDPLFRDTLALSRRMAEALLR
jgi:glucose-6-phosphate dehydrogenase assembly protein OpcA